MSSAAAVLRVVLSLVAPPAQIAVELLEVAPAAASPNVEAFVPSDSRKIYLISSSPVFLAAMQADPAYPDYDAIIKLASIIAHEVWHIEHGPDERSAYEAQLTTLARLGRGAGTPVYGSVQRSMLAVLNAQKKSQPAILIARR